MKRLAAAFALATLASLPAMAQSIDVHVSPDCSCCKAWVRHLEQSGFTPRVIEGSDLAALKRRHGVPEQAKACHTALIGGYVVEGHVPAADIRRLLAEKPQAAGIAVPDMPVGSPGMEVAGSAPQPYQTLLIDKAGATSVYARH